MVNEAQERLILAGGETGWWGSWVRTAFTIDSVTNPYITLPRNLARAINMDICKAPVPIQNEFYEFLEFGVGLQPQTNCAASTKRNCNLLETYDRGLFPTFTDMTAGKKLRFYITDSQDINRRVLVQGTDSAGMTIYSLDGTVQVNGIFLNLTSPFVDTPFTLSTLTGLQKDVTVGIVRIFQVDPTTGEQELISTMEPTEEVAGYRRYFLNGLPRNCCEVTGQDSTAIQVSAMAKLAFIPALVDTDYLTIQNIPALKEECAAVRYAEMDDSLSEQKAQIRHRKAINLLNGELIHFLGQEKPAVNFAPFGSARLVNQRIGSLV